jgi:hypothetical protein
MTTVLGANFVNAVRVAFNRTSIHRGSPPFSTPSISASRISTAIATTRR